MSTFWQSYGSVVFPAVVFKQLVLSYSLLCCNVRVCPNPAEKILCTTAALGSEETGHCRQVAVMRRQGCKNDTCFSGGATILFFSVFFFFVKKAYCCRIWISNTINTAEKQKADTSRRPTTYGAGQVSWPFAMKKWGFLYIVLAMVERLFLQFRQALVSVAVVERRGPLREVNRSKNDWFRLEWTVHWDKRLSVVEWWPLVGYRNWCLNTTCIIFLYTRPWRVIPNFSLMKMKWTNGVLKRLN